MNIWQIRISNKRPQLIEHFKNRAKHDNKEHIAETIISNMPAKNIATIVEQSSKAGTNA